MAATATYKCKSCGNPFEARTADRARGWAKFCSKSCKAVKQAVSGGGRSRYPRHDGVSEMKHKDCEQCSRKAVNGLYEIDGRIHWYCHDHLEMNSASPFSSESLGQW
jgi:hypothetical protein